MEAESSCTTNTSTTATTTYIPLPAAVLYRSLTEPFLDAPRRLQPQFDSHTHQKSFSTDASSSAQKPASTKSQRLEKTRRGHSTSNIPTVSPRQQQKNHASPKSLAAITLSLNSDPYSEATVSDICSPESELSTSTTRSLSPRKNHSNPSNSESRSKRPPASHSSYGIETSTGPPPSFSTQRTLSQDRMWKPPTPESSDASPTLKQGFFTGDMSASQAHGSGASPKHKAATDREDFETPDAAELDREPLSRTEEYNTPKSAGEHDRSVLLNDDNAKGGIDGSATEDNNIPSSGEDQQSGKSEDIFLQIVKSEAGRSDISPHSERRVCVNSVFVANSSVFSLFHESSSVAFTNAGCNRHSLLSHRRTTYISTLNHRVTNFHRLREKAHSRHSTFYPQQELTLLETLQKDPP